MSEVGKDDDIRQAVERWENDILKDTLEKFPERKDEFITTSSEIVNRLYTPLDLSNSTYEEKIGYHYSEGVV